METASNHEYYMRRCFDLARLGLSETAPNPMVGSVIVRQGKVIGEGYHHKFGDAHAEVNAINSVTDQSMLRESTLYVNLEPCSHFGKTPPCSDLIIQHHIPRVIVSNTDPHRLVQGKGIEKLRKAGVEVITDILKPEGEELNRRFFMFHRKNRPYIILKWAQTKDGFIDIERSHTHPQKPTWITSEEARMLVHKWRAEEQAIMVGTNTAFLDNPLLNVREWTGKSPIRILIDRHMRLPQNLHLFDGTIPTLVFTARKTGEDETSPVEFITIPFDEYLPEHILGELYRRNILSLIIEGGTTLINSFLEGNLWDEARVFTGKYFFVSGVPAPRLNVAPVTTEYWEDFHLDIFRRGN
jgi:diaminohydroxyphosphoribosylaminopyrimidine deaminase / 5-amino-6-(5-phosphoribosylamino)uracil reductase